MMESTFQNRSASKYPVDLNLFQIKAHNPSFQELSASMSIGQRPIKDFCVPANPYFPNSEIMDVFLERLPFHLKYYPPSNAKIAEKLAKTLNLNPSEVVLGNGSTELITWIDRLFIDTNLITSVPTFGRWTDQPRETGKEVILYHRTKEHEFQIEIENFVKLARERGAKVAVISNPNNPTGALLSKAEVQSLVEAMQNLDLIVIDESFIEFACEFGTPTFEREAGKYSNVLVLKSLGKNFGLHGMRLGYSVGNVNLIAKLRSALPHWNINGVGDLVIELFASYQHEYESGRRHVIRDRILMEESLRSIDSLTVFPSKANFVYIQVPFDVDGVALRNRLLTDHGLFIRECGNKIGSTSNHFRIASRPTNDTAELVSALRQSLYS